MKQKFQISHLIIHMLFVVVCLFTIVPILSILNVALKTHEDFLKYPTALAVRPIFQNFVTAWTKANMGNSFKNSIVLAVFTPLGVCFFSTMAAFPICRRHFKGANFIYSLFVVSLFLPTTAGLIPLIMMFRAFHLMNHLYGLIISGWAGIALPVLIISGYLKSIPRDLDEAAVLDGCGYLRYIFKVIFPLAMPVIVTVLILSILGAWNNFLGPYLFLTDPSMRPLSTALYMFVGTYSTDYTVMCAGVIIATVPIILAYVFLQRYIISGMVSGAIKG
jgi:raffinose/stachyose/melibiose transport system permease protein